MSQALHGTSIVKCIKSLNSPNKLRRCPSFAGEEPGAQSCDGQACVWQPWDRSALTTTTYVCHIQAIRLSFTHKLFK